MHYIYALVLFIIIILSLLLEPNQEGFDQEGGYPRWGWMRWGPWGRWSPWEHARWGPWNWRFRWNW
jgi:hypothetical protein